MPSMIKCEGCGFNVEPEDAGQMVEYSDSTCTECIKCKNHPELAEAYRRGFNAGLDALAKSVLSIVQNSNLRKFPKS